MPAVRGAMSPDYLFRACDSCPRRPARDCPRCGGNGFVRECSVAEYERAIRRAAAVVGLYDVLDEIRRERDG